MIHYRSFRNSDTPLLVDLWRSQPRSRGLAQPASVAIFEQLVLAKPYFDNQGLILALEEQTAVGFVHAGFGASDDFCGLDRQLGVTSLLIVRPSHQQSTVGAELIARSEQYLVEHGAQVLYAGGIRPLDPFYLGLYGGSELPGVLASDTFANGVFQAAGYREIDRVVIYEREIAAFRATVDRRQMQIRRTTTVVENLDAAPRNWWEACGRGQFQIVAFDLIENDRAVASARFWVMETFSASRGVATAGLYELEAVSERRRAGLATFLLGDAFRRLAAQGIAVVEVQTMLGNVAARQLYARLGFQEVEQGIAYRKSEAPMAEGEQQSSGTESGPT